MPRMTFGERADKFADSADDQPWSETRHAHLSRLYTAFWLGEFEDDDGNSVLTIDFEPAWKSSPDPCTRDLMLQLLPTGSIRTPKKVQSYNPKTPPYDVLAAMKARQYPSEFSHMELIAISDEDYRAFLRRHNEPEVHQDGSHQKSKRKPKRNAKADKDLERRIKLVVDTARKKWPDPYDHPPFRVMAKELELLYGHAVNFKRNTISKILRGKYRAAQRLNISPPW